MCSIPVVPFYISKSVQGFQFLHSLVNTCHCLFLLIAILICRRPHLILPFDLLTLISDVEHLLMLTICLSSREMSVHKVLVT